MPELKNYMEIVVLKAVDEMISQSEICPCEICRFDIAAIALNQLPPKYVVTDIGELYTKANRMDLQNDVDLFTNLAKAAEIVKQFPRHSNDSIIKQ